jgi:hypothetical protein
VNCYEYKSPIYNTAEFLTWCQDRTNASLCAGHLIKNNDTTVNTGITFRLTVILSREHVPTFGDPVTPGRHRCPHASGRNTASGKDSKHTFIVCGVWDFDSL